MSKTNRRHPEIKTINGVKMVTGSTGFMVRNKTVAWLNPVPSDWRTNPTDVVEVTLVGWDPEEEEFVFDDGRSEEEIFLTAAPEQVERELFSDRAAAEKAARREGRYLAKQFAREDYARLHLRLRLLREKSKNRRRLIRAADSRQLGEIARAFGFDPYKLFRGLAGFSAAKQDKVIALTCGLKVQRRKSWIAETLTALQEMEGKWGVNALTPRAKGTPRKKDG